MRTRFLAVAAGVALSGALAFTSAHAGIVNGNQFAANTSTTVLDGISWTMAPTGRTFQHKASGNTCTSGAPYLYGCTSSGGYIGVGISGGRTNDEIDVGEWLIGSWTGARTVTSLTLGVLYDGPEFGDFQEVAQVTFNLAGGGTAVYRLTNSYDTNGSVATWTGGAGSVVQLSDDASGDTATNGAVWRVEGINLGNVIGVSFTALNGTCGNGACNNQSDYTMVQFATKVPEPASLGLVGAALLALGFVRRRVRT
jgi:hypothetical protein